VRKEKKKDSGEVAREEDLDKGPAISATYGQKRAGIHQRKALGRVLGQGEKRGKGRSIERRQMRRKGGWKRLMHRVKRGGPVK